MIFIIGLVLYSYFKIKEAEEEKERAQKVQADINALESQKD